MPDTTVKKVESASSPRGEMGQKYLVAGKHVSMRLWGLKPGAELKAPTRRDYETVGYVISGRAKLDLEGQTIRSVFQLIRNRKATFGKTFGILQLSEFWTMQRGFIVHIFRFAKQQT